MLYGRTFPLKQKGTVYKNNVKPAILYESKAWWLKESEIEFYKGQKDHW